MSDPRPGIFVEVKESNPHLLEKLAGRMLEPEFGMSAIRAFEAEEQAIFASYGGKYVKTGALEASLTHSGATGAIRELRPGELKLGSSIYYARFQGTTGKGHHHPPSAILKATALEAAAAAYGLKEYIMHGRQENLI